MQTSSSFQPPASRPHPGLSKSGPAPHEDHTIADHVEAMRIQDDWRPGKACFTRDTGERVWLDETHVEEFLRQAGALHPNDYESQFGRDWTLDFLNPTSPQDHGNS